LARTAHPIKVDADLVISNGNDRILVTGSGDRLKIDWQGSKRSLVGLPLTSGGLTRLDKVMKSCGLRIDLMLNDRQVGRLGMDARPAFIDRILGLAPIQASYHGLLRTLVGR
jgi:hypothetical protein